MSRHATRKPARKTPPSPSPRAHASDADRLLHGLPLESGEAQPRPRPARRLH
ncbi:MAG TPA: hypothetical protein VIG68_01635 [Lysobacter sp.]